ncbi:MAG: proprotein convertase P-domain-containing protein, partial [Nitrososphaerales archaeon]
TPTASVVINAAPTAVAGTPVSTCANSGAVNITAGSSATNQSSVLWTSSGTGTFTNANSLTGATYTPSAADTTAHVLTLTLTANGNGSCAAVTSTKTLTINAIPTITIVPTTATICEGSIQSLTATSNSGISVQPPKTFSSGTINVNIPDATKNNYGEVNTPITVSGIPGNAVITNVTVTINATASVDGDLNFNIQAPNGLILNLINRRGGSSNKGFTNTSVTGNGGVSLGTGSAPFTGTFAPDASTGIGPGGNTSNVTSFSSLASSNGTWTLYAEDVTNNSSSGTIKSWSVNIEYYIPVPNPVTWSPVTDLYTDAGATIPYTGQSLTTVYAEPSS